MIPSTFPDALSSALGGDPGRPFVTFYDDASGERIELSVTTYANWVSKTANLLQDELDLEAGSLVLVDLPTHWLTPVVVGGAWSAGLVVTDDESLAGEADLVVCGPDGVDRYAGTHPDRVLALSLRPMGARFRDPLPPGVVDYGAVVLGQPDVFLPYDAPTAGTPAYRDADGVLGQQELLTLALESGTVSSGGRLLTDLPPLGRRGASTLLATLLHTGSTVWVAHPDADAWERHAEAERVTDRWPA